MALKKAIQGAVKSAFQALGDLVSEVPYHVRGIEGYSPSTSGPTIIEEGGWDEMVSAVRLSYEAKEIDGTAIQAEDVKILLDGTAIAFRPKKADTIQFDDDIYEVVRVEADPTQSVWTLQGRPVDEEHTTTI